MRVSLKARIILLLLLLSIIPVALYLYHNSAMRDKMLEDRLKFNSLYASSIVSKVELFLERVMSEARTLVYLYRNLGFSEEEIIWRVSGHVKGIFEGGFYSREGILMGFASRENVSPTYQKFLRPEELEGLMEIRFSPYKEPFLKFSVPDVEGGVVRGYFVFSLDLSLFWQSVVSTRPGHSIEVFLADGRGNILAFSDMRFSDRRELPLKEGIYTSHITGVEVIGVYARSEDGKWIVAVEEPVSVVLEPLYSFQRKALFAGTMFMGGVGFFAVLVFLRIFRPLDSLKNRILHWEKENVAKPVDSRDEVEVLSTAFENLIRKLEEEKKLYSSMFENTLDGIILFNSQKRVIDLNRTMMDQYGIKKEEFVGKHMRKLIGEELPLMSMFFSEKKISLNRDIYCQLRQEVLKVEGNTYVVWRIRDVSREKELKVLLEQTAKLSLAGEIACSIAHQMNNPLASVIGYAESILLESDKEEDRRKAEIILKHAEKCAETVRKLLDVGKPFEGKPEQLKPEEITIDAINILSSKAKRKGVKIEFESSLNGERVFTFRWQVEQVLINLIDNAIDASPSRSVVSVSLEKEGGKVVWKIRDRGKGMSEEEIEKVFKPFYTTKPYGTGLGLSLARRLITNLGGEVRIKSSKGEGTLVEVILAGSEDENTDS